MVLFLRNNRFNVTLILDEYQLRWWRLLIEERTCLKTHLGGGDYSLRISGLPPLLGVSVLEIQGFPLGVTPISRKSPCKVNRM